MQRRFAALTVALHGCRPCAATRLMHANALQLHGLKSFLPTRVRAAGDSVLVGVEAAHVRAALCVAIAGGNMRHRVLCWRQLAMQAPGAAPNTLHLSHLSLPLCILLLIESPQEPP